MEVIPTIDALALVRRRRAEDPRRRADPLPAGVPEDQAQLLLLRAARGRRRDRPVELPLVDPVRRGRARPDRRQRRRAQAGEPHAAAGRADPAGLRRRGLPGGPRADGARRRRDRPGAVRGLDGEDLLHRVGRGGAQGRRALRRAHEGQRARARRQGPADRLRRRRPRERGLGLRVGRVRQRGADLLGDRAHLRGRGGGRRVPRRRAPRDRAADRRRPARMGHGDRPDGLRGAGRPGHRARRRRARGRRRPAHGRAAATCRATTAASSRRPCSPASPTRCRS